jgi:peptidoglycan/LPS O-acetylase OafA/YrhL
VGPRLGDLSPSRANVFDVLRLLAALAVLLSHCYALTGRADPFGERTGATLGELGVSVFFAISGFLVARSWASQPALAVYAAKRALRLLPGLIVAVWLTALVLGPLVTTLPLGDYLTTPQTWIYPLRSSVLITFHGQLPGVFEDNPLPDAVNGSLWTLPVEAFAYGIVAVLGVLALVRRGPVLLALLVALLAAQTPWVDLVSYLPAAARNTAAGANTHIVLQLLTTFVAGSALFALRDRVRLSWWVALALCGAWVLSWKTEWWPVLAALFVPYAVLVLAYRLPRSLNVLARPGDVSYGVYVYAFPVQQTVVLASPKIAPAGMAAFAIPITYALALASWRLVERPALDLKKRLAPRSLEPRTEAPGSPHGARHPTAG